MAVSSHAQAWKRWRVKNLLSQSSLSRALGMSLRAVQYIEAGRVCPNYISQSRFQALKERYKKAGRK